MGHWQLCSFVKICNQLFKFFWTRLRGRMAKFNISHILKSNQRSFIRLSTWFILFSGDTNHRFSDFDGSSYWNIFSIIFRIFQINELLRIAFFVWINSNGNFRAPLLVGDDSWKISGYSCRVKNAFVLSAFFWYQRLLVARHWGLLFREVFDAKLNWGEKILNLRWR